MRLIDADALKPDYYDEYVFGDDEYVVRYYSETQIDNAPSIDRPHGEWILCREFVEDTPFAGCRCSNCNYWKSMGAWNFCPQCGADMRGADDE